MQLFYKIFLALYVIFIGFNLYMMEWNLGIWHEENSKFILSAAAAVLGIIIIGVMHNMSRLAVKK